MTTYDNSSPDNLTRLFERLARWMGISINTAPVLHAFFVERYGLNRRLSSEEVCELTGYSRANAGLIISNLENSGVLDGVRDYSQPGRGRKRVLYTLAGGVEYMLQMGIKNQITQLKEMMEDIEFIKNDDYVSEDQLRSLLSDFENIVDDCMQSIDSLRVIQKQEVVTKSE